MTAAEVDALHRPSAKTMQLLAINILPQMQQRGSATSCSSLC
jgi:hypothetical protein